ncbi:MAG: 4-(cytidine 5'-diphospho)-2-C-methyl-D-erythritol kinase [Bacillota bacterium]
MCKSMVVKAPAKINLGLAVLKRRSDGYHDLLSIMQQVSLADTLTIEPVRGAGLSFSCSDPSLNGEDNLVCRAAALLAAQTRKALPGVKIDLYKNIPVEAGLGGGSSDAAAALSALNRYWRLDLTAQTLGELGSRLGSDIPFCLQGGTALASGRGEVLQPLPGLSFFWVVLAVPAGLGLSTASVFRALNLEGAPRPPIRRLIAAVQRESREEIVNWLEERHTNSLEAGVVAAYPRLMALKKRMRELGLVPVMSGSGPTFFALTGGARLAGNAVRILRDEGYRAYLCWTERSTR